MTDIVTITPNPSVDLSTSVERIVPVAKLRGTSQRRDPGGGGINVARVIKRLGGDVSAIYSVGGVTGDLLRTLLDKAGVASRTFAIAEETREDFFVSETSTGQPYRFILPGPELSDGEWQECLRLLSGLEPFPRFVVASGSLPRGVPEDFYARLAALAASRRQHFVLDSSGSALKAALGKGISLIKPSLSEFEGLVGHEVRDPREQDTEAVRLARAGAARLVVVSLGAAGAVMASDRGSLRLPAPRVQVRSAVGAGDSFVAAMTLGLARGLPAEDAFAWGIAAGSAAVMRYGTAHPQRSDIDMLHDQILAQTPASDR